MNIYEKMSAITAEITAVAKNLNVGWGSQSYKAVGEADVLAAVKPIEEKHRIYSYPVSREIIESAVLTTIKKDGSESKQQFMRIQTVYRFVDMDKPDDHIDITTYGDGVDSQDKSPGKAMTYADKYALLKAYKIITGDDPDQNLSEPLKGKKEKTKPQQTEQTKKPDEKPVTKPAVISPAKVTALTELLQKNGIRTEYVCKLYNVPGLDAVTEKQHQNIVEHIGDLKKKQEEATA